MIKAMIVDDEPYCCQTLVTLLQRFCPEVDVAGVFYSGRDAIDRITRATPEILFLDVEMPELNGFELLEQLGEINFELIFTTSYDQYALKAFHFSALDYLLKPIDREELQKAVQKAFRRQLPPMPQQISILLQSLQHPAKAMSKIALPTLEGLQMVGVESIITCASEGNYTIIFLKNHKKITVSRILKEIEELLHDHPFARVHNSYLVNLNEIEKYIRGEGGYLVMSDGTTVDVSRSRKDALLKRLSS